jgi:hypothetical protein
MTISWSAVKSCASRVQEHSGSQQGLQADKAFYDELSGEDELTGLPLMFVDASAFRRHYRAARTTAQPLAAARQRGATLIHLCRTRHLRGDIGSFAHPPTRRSHRQSRRPVWTSFMRRSRIQTRYRSPRNRPHCDRCLRPVRPRQPPARLNMGDCFCLCLRAKSWRAACCARATTFHKPTSNSHDFALDLARRGGRDQRLSAVAPGRAGRLAAALQRQRAAHRQFGDAAARTARRFRRGDRHRRGALPAQGQPTIFRIPSFSTRRAMNELSRRAATPPKAKAASSRGRSIRLIARRAVWRDATPCVYRRARRPDGSRRWHGCKDNRPRSTRSTARSSARSSLPAAFAELLAIDGEPAALAYGVIHRGMLCFESVVTERAARRRRAMSRRVLAALAAWAKAERRDRWPRCRSRRQHAGAHALPLDRHDHRAAPLPLPAPANYYLTAEDYLLCIRSWLLFSFYSLLLRALFPFLLIVRSPDCKRAKRSIPIGHLTILFRKIIKSPSRPTCERRSTTLIAYVI